MTYEYQTHLYLLMTYASTIGCHMCPTYCVGAPTHSLRCPQKRRSPSYSHTRYCRYNTGTLFQATKLVLLWPTRPHTGEYWASLQGNQTLCACIDCRVLVSFRAGMRGTGDMTHAHDRKFVNQTIMQTALTVPLFSQTAGLKYGCTNIKVIFRTSAASRVCLLLACRSHSTFPFKRSSPGSHCACGRNTCRVSTASSPQGSDLCTSLTP